MLSIIKTLSDANFFNLISESKKEIILCAPFIKKDIAKEILNTKCEDTKLVVITSANISNFIQSSSDIEAIKMLLSNKIKVKNYQNLHAKIYLFDSSKAIITSANLTCGGFYTNYEYGVLIENDGNIIKNVNNDINCMMKSELCGEFKDDIISYIESIPKILDTDSYKISEIDGDKIISLKKYDKICKGLNKWQKDVFNCLVRMSGNEFTLQDIYAYSVVLNNAHPSNHNVEAKIRQILQQLRDRGLIKFISRGNYKKLFS